MNFVYRFLLKIPVLGEVLHVINSYTFDGDEASNREFAPIECWFRKHTFSILLSLTLAFLSSPGIWPFSGKLIYYCYSFTSLEASIHKSVSDLIISIYPTVLGFGIGAYALVFSFSSKIIKDLHKAFKKSSSSRGSALIINCDMAYPLLVLTVTIFVAVLFDLYNEVKVLEVVAWFAFWYSGLMVFEVIFSLFYLAETEIYNKQTKKKNFIRSKKK